MKKVKQPWDIDLIAYASMGLLGLVVTLYLIYALLDASEYL